MRVAAGRRRRQTSDLRQRRRGRGAAEAQTHTMGARTRQHCIACVYCSICSRARVLIAFPPSGVSDDEATRKQVTERRAAIAVLQAPRITQKQSGSSSAAVSGCGGSTVRCRSCGGCQRSWIHCDAPLSTDHGGRQTTEPRRRRPGAQTDAACGAVRQHSAPMRRQLHNEKQVRRCMR